MIRLRTYWAYNVIPPLHGYRWDMATVCVRVRMVSAAQTGRGGETLLTSYRSLASQVVVPPA